MHSRSTFSNYMTQYHAEHHDVPNDYSHPINLAIGQYYFGNNIRSLETIEKKLKAEHKILVNPWTIFRIAFMQKYGDPKPGELQRYFYVGILAWELILENGRR
ncbi:MAG: hypothetical protein MMC33_008366 [Icmadophila ericetorum]|nr:hypothetical protein [Icmadophila ericetorum]